MLIVFLFFIAGEWTNMVGDGGMVKLVASLYKKAMPGKRGSPLQLRTPGAVEGEVNVEVVEGMGRVEEEAKGERERGSPRL